VTSRYDRWEYHVEPAGPSVDVGRLNALGADGWELVAVHPSGQVILKRPAPDLRERVTLDQRAAVDAAHQEEGTS